MVDLAAGERLGIEYMFSPFIPNGRGLKLGLLVDNVQWGQPTSQEVKKSPLCRFGKRALKVSFPLFLANTDCKRKITRPI